MDPSSHAVSVNATLASVAAEIAPDRYEASPGNKTLRLIFDAAHGRTDLNVAIIAGPDAISSCMLNRRWTALRVSVNGQQQTVYVNINSLCKRLSIAKSEVFQAIRDHTLEALVTSRVQQKLKAIAGEETKTHPSLIASEKSASCFIDRVKGMLVDAWWSFTTGSWDLFRFRFLIGASDEQLQEAGQLRALGSFQQAVDSVPFYKKFLSDNGGIPQNFQDIPLTDKKSYIQKAEFAKDLHVGGELPTTGQLDSSTGTTGAPTLWRRGGEELAMTQKLMGYARKAKFGSDTVMVINTFALGLWATGVTLAGAGPSQGLTANVGMSADYLQRTLGLIKDQVKNNPKEAIVLCGYPPNIRKIAEEIKKDPELQGIALNLHAIVGGEGMTEDVRTEILGNGFQTVYSSYGASDLDINIGYETATEVAIRQACIKNPKLAEELYGGGPPPMIFQYDPLHYFIETTKEGELVFTCCRKERSSPRVRYNLHDHGKVMMSKDVVAIMKKYGVEITPRTNLPLLFVFGREGTATYGGAKVHYEHLLDALDHAEIAAGVNKDRVALHKPTDNELEFWIEAKSEEDYETMKQRLPEIEKKIIEKVVQENKEFSTSFHNKNSRYPHVRLFRPKMSPMSRAHEKHPERKLQRVVPASDELRQQLAAHADHHVVSSGDYS